VIVQRGYITKEKRDETLTKFTEEQNKRDKTLPPFSYIEVFKKERPVIEKFTSHTVRILQRMSGIFVKFDWHETVNNNFTLPEFSAQVDHFNEQGDRVIRYIMLLKGEMAQILHTKICRRNGVDETLVKKNETLCELLNIICYASCTSYQVFVKLNASVPQVLSSETLSPLDEKETKILVSLVNSYGPIKILLLFTWQE